MAYCDYSDVTALTGVSYSSTSTPTQTQVSEFINQTYGEIALAVDHAGITATSSEAAWSVLKKYNAIGATCLTLQRTAANPDEFQRQNELCDKYSTWLDKLMSDEYYKAMLRGDSYSTDIYAGNQVTAGTIDEADVKFMDEEFNP